MSGSCFRASWVTHRKIRNIWAIKGRRVYKIVSSEGLPLYDGELEKDGLHKDAGRLCPVLEARPCWKLHSAPDTWAVEMQTWQHEWFPCQAPNLLLCASSHYWSSHLCWELRDTGGTAHSLEFPLPWWLFGSSLPQLVLGLSSLPQVSRSCLQMWVTWHLFLPAGVTGDNAVASVKWLPSAGRQHCQL